MAHLKGLRLSRTVTLVVLILLTMTALIVGPRLRYNTIKTRLHDEGISLEHGDRPLGPITLRATFNDFLWAVKSRGISAVYYDEHAHTRGLYWAHIGLGDDPTVGYVPPFGLGLK